MGFLVASLITLAVLGSVMWVMPSIREKSLISMRNKALSLGIKVRLVDEKLSKALFPWLDNYRGYTLYEKLLPPGKKSNSFKARVVRVSDDPNAHEIDAVDPLRQQLISHNLFESLPSTVEALVISASGIALLWREYQLDSSSLAEVEKIDECLVRCIEASDLWMAKL